MQNSRAAHGTYTKKRKDISVVNEEDTQIEVSNNAPKKASTTNKYGNRDHPRAHANDKRKHLTALQHYSLS